MQTSRTLGILFLFAALGAAAIWFLGFQGGQADPVPSAVAAVAAPGAPAVAAPEHSGVGAAVEDVTTRVSAPALVGSGSGAPGANRGLSGQVLDDQGAPVVGALVRCSSGFGEGMGTGEAFDFAEIEDFDPAAMMDRFRTAMKDRTEATTDAEGRFRLAAVGAGRNVGIRVTARHFVVLDKNVPRPTEADADLGVLTVKRGALVSGRVLDRAGTAIVGARVQRADRSENNFGMGDFEFPGAEEMQGFVGDEQAVTDAEGRFELAHIAPGDFSLRARHVDHPIAKLDGLTAQPGATLEGLLVVVEPGVTISGRITGVPDGQKPLRVMASVRREERQGAGAEGMLGMMGDAGEMMADAGFGFGEKQLDTAADFTFTLRGLQVGKTYRVWASQNGRGFAGNSMCTQRIEVLSGTAGLELRFDAGITVTFQVQDSQSGAPIERLWVRDQLRGGGGMEDMMAFLPRGGRSKAYPDGMVTIASLRPKKKQSLSLTVEAIGYGSFERKDMALPTAGTLDLGVLKLDPAPVVQVTVTSGAEGRPVAGATVRLTEASKAGKASDNPFDQLAAMAPGMMGGGGNGPRTGKTDAQGRCDLNAFTGAMVVAVTSKEHAPYNSAAFESSGVRTAHQAVLLRGGSVEVTVLDNEGKPLASARVDHTMPTGERDNRETDKLGVALFERLAPGEHRFRLGKRGGGPPGMEMFQARLRGAQGQDAAAEVGWQSAQVDDGARVALSLSKAATATLRGLVRENGVPLVGARVAFVEGAEDRNPDGGLEQRVSDMMGEMGGGGGGGRGRNARTGADGSYQLSEVPEGLHRLRITTKERVMPAVVQVSLRTGENVFDVELDATVLRGIVKDSTGAPVAGAAVSIVPVKAKTEATDERTQAIEEAMAGGFDLAQMGGGGRSQVKTGDDGSYELRGVQAGKPVQVKASAKGFAAALSAVVELAAGGTKDGVDITLGASGKVKVEVAEASPFAQVRAVKVQADGTAEAGVAPVSQMMRNGKCTLDGLRPGRWKVEVRGMQSPQRDPLFVEVTAGETATLNF